MLEEVDGSPEPEWQVQRKPAKVSWTKQCLSSHRPGDEKVERSQTVGECGPAAAREALEVTRWARRGWATRTRETVLGQREPRKGVSAGKSNDQNF